MNKELKLIVAAGQPNVAINSNSIHNENMRSNLNILGNIGSSNSGGKPGFNSNSSVRH